jgi:hypothetical protein
MGRLDDAENFENMNVEEDVNSFYTTVEKFNELLWPSIKNYIQRDYITFTQMRAIEKIKSTGEGLRNTAEKFYETLKNPEIRKTHEDLCRKVNTMAILYNHALKGDRKLVCDDVWIETKGVKDPI